jgi:diguanylate cyclase (GGDEF)-like protein
MAKTSDRDNLRETAAAAASTLAVEEVRAAAEQRLDSLLAASRGIAAEVEVGDVAARVAVEARGLLCGRASSVEVWTPDGEGGFSVVRATGRRTRRSGRRAEADALAREATSARLPVQRRRGRSTRVVAPIARESELGGFIDIRCRDGAELGADEVGLVWILATHAAVALENARLHERIERQAITDDLTGLYNCRYFYERLRQEFRRSVRYRIPLSLLMLDLDDFKLLNDRHGRLIGDEVLCEISRVLLQEVRRDVDLAARYGGEEFAILLPNTPTVRAPAGGRRARKVVTRHGIDAGDGPSREASPAGARETPAAARVATARGADVARLVGERIRRYVESAAFASRPGGRPMRVTVSVGVATWPGDADDGEGLVAAADKALYLAKRLGKNRVESFR